MAGDVQDFHTDSTQLPATNASLLTAISEAHRCGCLPQPAHMWFHDLPTSKACYSVTAGVDCDAASATYATWAAGGADAVRSFGLSAVGYVQNRDMEGECNGLLSYDAAPKLNATAIAEGNRLLVEAHAAVWGS